VPRDKMPCCYFSITASAAVIKSSSGSLMQCSVSLASVQQELLDIYYSRTFTELTQQEQGIIIAWLGRLPVPERERAYRRCC
jgi:hypothetical protein